MSDRNRPRSQERGQSAVLVALALLVMMAMLALTFDGANAYFQRRRAQTAADGGALAGGRVLCSDTPEAASATAYDYAVNYNLATDAEVVVGGGLVTVTTAITFPTTFGNVLGVSEMTAGATAVSGCLRPTAANGILPIGYSCEGAIGVEPDGDPYCTDLLYGPDNLYIVMDSANLDTDIQCISDGGTVNCDIDNDGVDEVLLGGNRSWLDLSGSGRDSGNGSSELCYWIEGNSPDYVHVNTWYGGQTGVSNNLFLNCVTDILMSPRLLPVYDAIHEGWPACPATYCNDVVVGSSGNTMYYHVISFALFVPTCVRAQGSDHCPLFDYLKQLERDHPGDSSWDIVDPNTKTVEGYFIQGFVTDVEAAPGGIDTGVYTVNLLR